MAQSPTPCHLSKDQGAFGGATRMGAGTQPAWRAPLPPFACGHATGSYPPPLSPSQCVCNGAALNLSHANWGALRGSRCPSHTACEHDPACIPRARPLCPTVWVLHSRRHMQGGMQKVGRAGVVHAAQHTGRAHIPSLRCTNRRPHIGNAHWPCSPNPLQTGVR